MKRVIVAVAIFLILAAGTALAATPIGQWNFTPYIAPNLWTGHVQGICFVAPVGNAPGTWFSTTFPGWSGQWIQNGDRIRFYGTTGVVSTAEFGQFISNNRFSGEFVHFIPSPLPVTTNFSGNFFMLFKSVTCDAPALSAYSASSVVDGDPALK